MIKNEIILSKGEYYMGNDLLGFIRIDEETAIQYIIKRGLKLTLQNSYKYPIQLSSTILYCIIENKLSGLVDIHEYNREHQRIHIVLDKYRKCRVYTNTKNNLIQMISYLMIIDEIFKDNIETIRVELNIANGAGLSEDNYFEVNRKLKSKGPEVESKTSKIDVANITQYIEESINKGEIPLYLHKNSFNETTVEYVTESTEKINIVKEKVKHYMNDIARRFNEQYV